MIVASRSLVSGQLVFETAITGPGQTPWDGDLGVQFIFNDRISFLEGDILHQNYTRIPNAVGWCANITDCKVQWNNFPNQPFPYPFYYLLGQSTVPTGAVSIDNIAYIFMMNVITWGDGAPGSVHANSFGIKGIPPTPFAPTTVKFGEDSKFVNIAPVRSPDGQTVYLFGSGLYRAAPISLARVPVLKIENMNALEYYTGSGFSSSYNDANTVIEGRVGELSAAWSTYKKQYLVSYCDFQPNGASLLRLGFSDNAWGPFNTNTILFDSSKTYSWMQPGWYGPYGGYIVPDQGVNTPWLYITLSLWNPYRVFIMKLDLSKDLPTVLEVNPMQT